MPYRNEDVPSDNRIAWPYRAIKKIEKRKEKWHILYTPCPNHQTLPNLLIRIIMLSTSGKQGFYFSFYQFARWPHFAAKVMIWISLPFIIKIIHKWEGSYWVLTITESGEAYMAIATTTHIDPAASWRVLRVWRPNIITNITREYTATIPIIHFNICICIPQIYDHPPKI